MDCDPKIAELLPWYVNGSLKGDEKKKVEEHLKVHLVTSRMILIGYDFDVRVIKTGQTLHASIKFYKCQGILTPPEEDDLNSSTQIRYLNDRFRSDLSS